MAEFPCFPLWTDSYLADTTHLTTIEHGAYFLLLMAMWRAKTKSLSSEDAFLCRVVKMTPQQWQRIKPVLIQFFDEEDGQITNGRLSDEADAVKRKSKRQSDKAKSRWLKVKKTPKAVAMPDECQTDASLTLNTTPVDTNVSTPLPPKGAFVLPDWIDLSDWKDFEDMRRRIKKPMTDRARNAIVSKLAQISIEGYEPKTILENSIRNSWQDVYPPKTEKGEKNGKQKLANDTAKLLERIRTRSDSQNPSSDN